MENVPEVDIPTRYIVNDKSLRDLFNLANTSNLNRVDFYNYRIDRSDLSEEQKKIQNDNHWYAEQNSDVYIHEEKFVELIDKVVYDKIFAGYSGDLFKAAYDDIMDTHVLTSITVGEKDSDNYKFEVNNDFAGVKKSGAYLYSRDIKELEEKLKDVKRHNSFMGNPKDKFVYLEKVTIGLYHYQFHNMDKKVDRMLKRFFRDNLTYCLKKNKVIVPEEYIKKGKDGIKEWRDLKQSENKNNSIEKKMIQKIARDKKFFAHDCMREIMRAAISKNFSWSIPSLEVEGRYNSQKVSKLVGQLIDVRNRQKMIEIEKEDIVNIFKSYWKNQLNDAIKEIDALDVEKLIEQHQ